MEHTTVHISNGSQALPISPRYVP